MTDVAVSIAPSSPPKGMARFGSAVLNLPPAVRLPIGSALARIPSVEMKLLGFMLSPQVRAEPWRLYAQLHDKRPVLGTSFGIWLVSRHADVAALARHPGMSVVESNARTYVGDLADNVFTKVLVSSMLFRDPPDHDRLRRLVARTFTPRRIEALRPTVEAMVESRLGALEANGRMDLLSELAYPLPIDVICDLLGVPQDARGRFPAWASAIAARMDIEPVRTPAINARGDAAVAELADVLHALTADPDRRLPGGLIGDLVDAEDGGQRLTRDEVVSTCALLLIAGHETTANLIGNGLLALFRNPSELERLRRGDVPMDVAVEELLRFAGPVQMTQRITMEPVEVGGQAIPPHELVVLSLAAANRDPDVFTDPNRLRLDRSPNPHVAFSSGIHACLGAALARLEAGIVLTKLLERFPRLRLDGKPRWRNTFVLRGLQSLPVAWD